MIAEHWSRDSTKSLKTQASHPSKATLATAHIVWFEGQPWFPLAPNLKILHLFLLWFKAVFLKVCSWSPKELWRYFRGSRGGWSSDILGYINIFDTCPKKEGVFPEDQIA